jgi:hypothetical protein
MIPMPLDIAINNRIAASALAPAAGFPPFTNVVAQGVFISNAWGTINITNIGKPTGAGSSKVGELKVMAATAFKNPLSQKELFVMGWAANGRPPQHEIDQDYLTQGVAAAKRTPFCGVCDTFTCATIAMLVGRNSPLPPGCAVEWFGMKSGGISGTGHAITVVDRTPGSAEANPATWGNQCLIVDQWYALQTGIAPAIWTNGPAQNVAYMTWLTSPGNTLWSIASFTVGQYPYVTI